MRTQAMVALLVLSFLGLGAQAQSLAGVDCSGLKAELKAMHQAQNVLLTNMIDNNDTMAETLDRYAVELKRGYSKKDFIGLKSSAQSFRDHKVREQKLVSRFNTATQALLQKVESCL